MSGALLEARGSAPATAACRSCSTSTSRSTRARSSPCSAPNGAGKTTTLRALSGMLPLMAGEVRLDGKPLKGTADKIARGGVVHVPQGRGIFPNLKVDETLRLACAMAGIRAGGGRRAGSARCTRSSSPSARAPHAARRDAVGRRAADARHRARADHEAARADDRRNVAGARPDDRARAVRDRPRRCPSRASSVLIVEQFVTHALAVASRAYVLEKGEVAFSGDAADARPGRELRQGQLPRRRRRRRGRGRANGSAELRFGGDARDCRCTRTVSCRRSRSAPRRRGAIAPKSCSSCCGRRWKSPATQNGKGGRAREVRRRSRGRAMTGDFRSRSGSLVGGELGSASDAEEDVDEDIDRPVGDRGDDDRRRRLTSSPSSTAP